MGEENNLKFQFKNLTLYLICNGKFIPSYNDTDRHTPFIPFNLLLPLIVYSELMSFKQEYLSVQAKTAVIGHHQALQFQPALIPTRPLSSSTYGLHSIQHGLS